MKLKLNFTEKSLLPLVILFSLCFCNSCTEENVITETSVSRQPMAIGAAYPVNTRATSAGFADGDRMGVYVVDYEKNVAGTLYDKGNRANNVRFVYQELDNRWKGATSIYWKDKYTPVDVYGYYPFQPNMTDVHNYPFQISLRQNLSGNKNVLGEYEASDFLWAKAEKVYPTTSTISLTYTHLMAGVRILLQKGTNFTDEEWSKLQKVVLVKNIVPNGNIDLSEGTVVVAGTDTAIVHPFIFNDEYRAVVIPQTLAKNRTIANITVGGVSYNFSKTTDLVLQSGRMHQFTIKVDKCQATGQFAFSLADEAILPWLDDADFHDGIMREYLVVEVKKGGDLKKEVLKTGQDFKRVSNLKVKGHLSGEDFRFMREEMEMLVAVNLKEAIMVDDNDVPHYKLHGGAFNQKRMLTHVVFPDSLVEIGGNAFEKTSLMGGIIIPEGVKVICANAFESCSNLCGELVLPSTIEKVESGAFLWTSLSGNLHLPEGLKYIGGGAFAARFSGRLILPQSLTDLGGYAFSNCTFGGDLVIPQGIKIIEEGALSGVGDGNLEIPEGVVEIKANAFSGCRFKGELKLPESLKFIGTNAFAGSTFSKVIFPKGLAFLGHEAFKDCSRLAGIIRMPEKLTRIGKCTFENCPLLEGVVFPENITFIDQYAFRGCHVLNSIVCESEEPPLLHRDAFWGISRDNFSVEVPAQSVKTYQNAKYWKEFKRITEYSNFVCRPQKACAINSLRSQNLILNADGPWQVTHLPDWCKLSPMSGNKKTALTLTIGQMPKGSLNRNDSIVFELTDSKYLTKCEVSQYDYQYEEDECVQLQKATRGRGVNIVFVGDGFDAESLSKNEYLDIVKQQVEYFFDIEPYTTYRDYFNVYTCISLSQENGVNTLNTYRNTCFETIYGGCADKLIPDENLIFDYVDAHSPMKRNDFWKGLVVLVPNTKEYGSNTTLFWDGSAISICAPSDNPDEMRSMVQHEAGGHGFGKLGDELIEVNLFAPSSLKNLVNDYHRRGWFQNVSTSGKMNEVPWAHFIFDPNYSDYVDIFEGGMGYTRGIYRSEINSCMNFGIPYYNAISRQDIMRRILDFSGEGFTMDKFYATDSKEFGGQNTKNTRALPYVERGKKMRGHMSPRIVNK